jgi:hypothetical protein
MRKNLYNAALIWAGIVTVLLLVNKNSVIVAFLIGGLLAFPPIPIFMIWNFLNKYNGTTDDRSANIPRKIIAVMPPREKILLGFFFMFFPLAWFGILYMSGESMSKTVIYLYEATFYYPLITIGAAFILFGFVYMIFGIIRLLRGKKD